MTIVAAATTALERSLIEGKPHNKKSHRMAATTKTAAASISKNTREKIEKVEVNRILTLI